MTDTPRTDALTARMAGELDRPMLASNHVIELCEHARDLERDLTACRAALRELVACKDMGERTEDWSNYETYTEWRTDKDAHEHREPLAWSAARAILQSTGDGETHA